MTNNKDNFIMLPTVDFCFKELMANPKVRQGFIAALLDVEPKAIQETTLLPTILPRRTEQDKLGILDVRILLADKTQIDMEMQVSSFEYWEKRILFYLSKMYADQLKKGEPYERLQKCIHVSILDFIYFQDDSECYRRISFRDDKTSRQYSDLMEIQILELPKLSQEIGCKQEVLDWMQFFHGKRKEEFEDMAKKNEYLDEAYHTLLELSADDRKRLEYEAREKALRDYNSQISSALKRGRKIGEEIGEARGREIGETLVRNVFKLHLQGKTQKEIAGLCEISEDKVREILE